MLFDGKQKKHISRTFFVVLKSLWEQEKTQWFTSQHVTKMRTMVKEQIYEMARAQQREEEEEKNDLK